MKILAKSLIITSGFLLSCEKAGIMKTSSFIQGKRDYTSSSGKLAISMEVIDDMKLSLVKSGMTNEEADVIGAGALAGLDPSSASTAATSSTSTANFALTGSGDATFYDLENAIPRLAGSAISTMKHPGANLKDGPSKLAISKAITSGIFGSLDDKISFLSSDSRNALPAGIAKQAVSNLDDAGLSGDELASGIGNIIDSSVSNLDDAGFDNAEMGNLVSALTKSTVEGMKDIGLEKSQIGGAMQALVKSAVGALGNAGVTADSASSFVGPILSEAVGGLDDIGLKGASQMQTVVGDLMASTVTALGEAGVTEISDISKALNSSVKGAMEGIGNAGVDKSKVAFFVDDMMKGAVKSFDKIGIKDASAIQSLSAGVASDTIGYLDDFGIKDKDSIKAASEAIATGTMAALGDLKEAGVIDKAAVEAASQAVSSKAVDAIYTHARVHGFPGEITDVASGFTDGMVAGLAEAGWNTTDISSVSDDIGTGFQVALADEAGFDQSQLLTMKSSIESSANTWIAGMELHCQQDRGIWYPETGWCEYPRSAPVAGAQGPSLAEEDDCYDKGGFVLFRGDGSWFCDIAAGEGEGLSTREECKNSGYQWVKGPEGAYCELYEPPSFCWVNLGKETCKNASDCSWVGSHCESMKHLSCVSYQNKDTCNQNDCMWDFNVSNCMEDPCKVYPNDPVCDSFNSQNDGGGGLVMFNGLPFGISGNTNLNIEVHGPNIKSFKYKLLPSSNFNACSQSSGYSSKITTPAYITDDISSFPDGPVLLCVVGQALNGTWMPYADAVAKDWEKGGVGLSNAPSGDWSDSTYTLNVVGSQISKYRYKGGTLPIFCSDETGYSNETDISQDITMNSIPDGPVGICIIGLHDVDGWQPFDQAYFADWWQDTVAPVAPDSALGWAEGASVTGTNITARWTHSDTSDVQNFIVKLYAGGDCNSSSIADYVKNESQFQHTFTNQVPNTYAYKVKALDNAGNYSESNCSQNITVSAPTVITDISAQEQDGTYGAGQTITFVVTFSNPVTIIPGTGTPKIKLNSGSDSYAFYTSGSNSNTATFTYTVQSGHQTNKLQTMGMDIDLAGGSIEDTNNAPIDKKLPDPTVLGGQNIQIDGIPPNPFNITSPTDNEMISGDIIVDWEPATDNMSPVTYNVKVGTNSTCFASLWEETTTTPPATITSGTLPSDTYYVCVDAEDAFFNITPANSSVMFIIP